MCVCFFKHEGGDDVNELKFDLNQDKDLPEIMFFLNYT